MTEGLSRQQVETIVSGFGVQEARVLRLIWEEGQAEQRLAMEQLPSLGDDIGRLLVALGLPPFELLQELRNRWEELAGDRWGSDTAPIVVRHGELLVEAVDHRIVRRLRYDTDRLMERLERRFGRGFVTSVRVVAPPRGKGW